MNGARDDVPHARRVAQGRFEQSVPAALTRVGRPHQDLEHGQGRLAAALRRARAPREQVGPVKFRERVGHRKHRGRRRFFHAALHLRQKRGMRRRPDREPLAVGVGTRQVVRIGVQAVNRIRRLGHRPEAQPRCRHNARIERHRLRRGPRREGCRVGRRPRRRSRRHARAQLALRLVERALQLAVHPHVGGRRVGRVHRRRKHGLPQPRRQRGQGHVAPRMVHPALQRLEHARFCKRAKERAQGRGGQRSTQCAAPGDAAVAAGGPRKCCPSPSLWSSALTPTCRMRGPWASSTYL